MNDVAGKARGAIAASCCLLALAAIATLLASGGQAQPPATFPAPPRDAVAAQPPGAAQAQPPRAAQSARRMPAPVVEAHDLMNLFNKPLYTHLKSDMAQQPADEEGWKTLEQRGLQAAEVANLVALRPAKPPQQEWLQGSANLQAAGIALAEAAKSKDWEKTVQAYQGLVQRCNACHQARAPETAPKLEP